MRKLVPHHETLKNHISESIGTRIMKLGIYKQNSMKIYWAKFKENPWCEAGIFSKIGWNDTDWPCIDFNMNEKDIKKTVSLHKKNIFWKNRSQ